MNVSVETQIETLVRAEIRRQVERGLAWLVVSAAGCVAAGYLLGLVWTRAWLAGLAELAR